MRPQYEPDEGDDDTGSDEDVPEMLTSNRRRPGVAKGATSHEETGDASESASDDENVEEASAHHGDVDDEEELQGQVADVPFEVIQKMRSDGTGVPHLVRRKRPEELKRANKNRPQELTAKRPVPRFREVIQAPKKVTRDPRFESLCGSFEEDRFKASYRFLYDEQMPAERLRLKKAMKKEKDPERKKDLQSLLTKVEQELKGEAQRRKKKERESRRKHDEKEAVQQGKKPYFPKKSETRKEELIEMYKELKAKGKLEAFLAKRRKKNAAKEHTKVPYRRPAAE